MVTPVYYATHCNNRLIKERCLCLCFNAASIKAMGRYRCLSIQVLSIDIYLILLSSHCPLFYLIMRSFYIMMAMSVTSVLASPIVTFSSQNFSTSQLVALGTIGGGECHGGPECCGGCTLDTHKSFSCSCGHNDIDALYVSYRYRQL